MKRIARPNDIPDSSALLAIESHRRFVCIVALAAVRNGVDVVRFEPRPGSWAILSAGADGWEEFLDPVDAAAAVPRMLSSMTRRTGLLGWLGFADPSGGFMLRHGDGQVIHCWVDRDGTAHQLRVVAEGVTSARAGDLLREYFRIRGHVPVMADEHGLAVDPARDAGS